MSEPKKKSAAKKPAAKKPTKQASGGVHVDKDGLNLRQKKFCDEYLKSGNANQSALAAGYSKNTSRAQSARLLANVNCQAYIKKHQEIIHEHNILDAIEIQQRLTQIALGQIEDENATVIDGMIARYTTSTKVKEQVKALELLAKINQMFTEKVDVSGGVNIVFGGEEDLHD